MDNRSLQNKTVAFVACGSDLNKMALYTSFANEYGLSILLLENSSNLLATRMQEDGILRHLKIDLSPRSGLVDDAISLIETEMTSRGKTLMDLDGVVTFWDDAVALASRIAAKLNLPGSPPHSIDISHDKYATRVALKNGGLPYPQHAIILSKSDLTDALTSLQFPLVLKPVQGATSIGVYVCKDEEQLMEAYNEGLRVLRSTYDLNELMGLVFDDSPESCTKDQDQLLSYVLEEYINGPEVDIDMIVSGGKVVYAKVSDDWEYQDPWRTETGVNYPSRLPENMHAEFITAASAVVSCFGISDSVLHTEMKYSSKYGPMLIEVNPRLGGGPCHFFHKHLYGVDLALEQVMIATGQGSNPEPKEPTEWGVGLLLYASESGTVSTDVISTEAFKECVNSKYVVNLSMPNKKGDFLHGWNSPDFPSHAGLLMCSIPKVVMSIEEACDYASNLRSLALSGIRYEA